ncbi:unnamed protein product, partial [Musa acuminata subsp. malaccensis]
EEANLTILSSGKILNLSKNNLSGTIPCTLIVLNFLNDLNLWYNHLSGKIPT